MRVERDSFETRENARHPHDILVEEIVETPLIPTPT